MSIRYAVISALGFGITVYIMTKNPTPLSLAVLGVSAALLLYAETSKVKEHITEEIDRLYEDWEEL